MWDLAESCRMGFSIFLLIWSSELSIFLREIRVLYCLSVSATEEIC